MFSSIKLWAIGISILAVVFCACYYTYRQRSIGAETERAKQEKENAEFVVKANKGAVSFDVCNRAGGLYDFAQGSCKLSAIVDDN